MSISSLRMAILGSGPIGLEAALAAAAAEAGYRFKVYEAAAQAAGHVREWGHVELFTPWDLNVSDRMRRALEQAGHAVPSGSECPTGSELVERVLGPVSALPSIADHIEYGVRVERIGRTGLLKHEEIGTGERGKHAFRLLLRDDSGREWTEEADVVVDCTGNTVPNALGDGGIPAPGEALVSETVSHDIPDVSRLCVPPGGDGDPDAWAGRTVLVVGAGHSATTAVSALVELAEARPDTRVVWALRGDVPRPEPDDPLEQRAALTARAAELAVAPPPCLEVRTGVVVDAMAWVEDRAGGDGTDATTRGKARRVGVKLRTEDGLVECVDVDRILAMTGKVGDHLLYRQLQVHECWATQGPMKLAAALMAQGGGTGDCLDQTSLGANTLVNPEPNLFILGIKSYGRRSDFLMRVGWEQVGEVFGLLAGG